jgi:hypothetical protein
MYANILFSTGDQGDREEHWSDEELEWAHEGKTIFSLQI